MKTKPKKPAKKTLPPRPLYMPKAPSKTCEAIADRIITKDQRPALMLALPDSDAGLVPADEADKHAQQLADETGEIVSVRDPVTDEIVAEFKPERDEADRPIFTEAEIARSQANIAAVLGPEEVAKLEAESLPADDLAVPAFLDRKLNPVEPATLEERRAFAPVAEPTVTAEPEEDATGKVRIYLSNKLRGLACGRHYVRVIKLGRKWVTFEAVARTSGGKKHIRVARDKWDQIAIGDEVQVSTEAEETTDMTTDTHKPTKAKSTKKATKKTTKAAPRKREAGQPEGKTAECIKLALRKGGVSPAELKASSGWTGAPWKWLFQNPKKTGWADKYGYKFKVTKVDGETRYCLTK